MSTAVKATLWRIELRRRQNNFHYEDESQAQKQECCDLHAVYW